MGRSYTLCLARGAPRILDDGFDGVHSYSPYESFSPLLAIFHTEIILLEIYLNIRTFLSLFVALELYSPIILSTAKI